MHLRLGPACVWAIIIQLGLLLNIEQCHADNGEFESVACLSDDIECRKAESAERKLARSRVTGFQSLGYESPLKIPFPPPGKDAGEEIAEQIMHLKQIPAGHECDTDDDCEDGLSCVGQSLSSSFSRRRKRQDLEGSGVCGRVLQSLTCDNQHGFECPDDSSIVEFTENNLCTLTCKCKPISDSCQRQTVAPTGLESSYPTSVEHTQHQQPQQQHLAKPGNCVPAECLQDVGLTSTKLNENSGNENRKNFGDSIEDSLKAGGGQQLCRQTLKGPHNQTSVIYASGQYWHSPNEQDGRCNECRCNQGVILCNHTFKYQCPESKYCVSAEEQYKLAPSGNCCPVCQDCFHKNQHYIHAQTWHSVDKCQTCTCQNNNVKCQEYACKPRTCAEGETPIKREDECCETCRIDACKLDCPNGRKTDAQTGLELCICLQDAQMPTSDMDNIDDDIDNDIDTNTTPGVSVRTIGDTQNWLCDSAESCEKVNIVLVCLFFALCVVVGALVAFVILTLVCKSDRSQKGHSPGATLTNEDKVDREGNPLLPQVTTTTSPSTPL